MFSRKFFQRISILFIYITLFYNLFAQTAVGPIDLKTEYLNAPLGIDVAHPRLSWRMIDNRTGARQSAYRILVDTDSMALLSGKGGQWNTRWVSGENALVSYKGKTLQPFTKYFWRVDLSDMNNRRSAQFGISSFESGLIERKNWVGSWISDSEDRNLKPAPYFRKVFRSAKKIRSARAYIAAAGLYELFLNGDKVGNHRLDPMYTRFDRRTLYVTYDITTQLTNGENAVGVLLGNGWYNHQSTAVWNFHNATWRSRPTFCMDIRLVYEDGSVETIGTGTDWKTSLSPVVFNSIYTAEHYDARLEQNGWNTVSFDASKWKNIVLRAAPSNNIVSQSLHPVRNVEEIPARTIRKFNDTNYVFDIGRNISGVSSISIQGEAGTIVRLKHGERLYPNGHVDLSNIDVHYRPTDDTDPFQTDILILSGREDHFMPRFNYKGFQFIEVTSSKPVDLQQQSVVAWFMHSDVPSVGHIKSSNPVLDKIWYATNNSYLSNLFGYPTDCPQREKNGWTGDAQIAIETGLYSFDGITVYEKWLADHRDEQQPNGVLPSIIPTSGWGYEWGNGPDWTSTIAIIPWNMYLFYGDTSLLSQCYDNIKRYVDHITEISPSGLTTWGLGDWVPVKSKTPVELTSTCYYFADVNILAQSAKMFGKMDEYTRYSALAGKIKSAFNAKYFNPKTGIYESGVQTALGVPLYWGLVPDSAKHTVAGNLAKRVALDSFHLDVGLLGQKAILNALSDNGFADVAYRIASQKTYPSWGWWVENGATTLYENWKIDSKDDISLNHIMFGEIGAWLYKGLGGIKPDARKPGFKNVLLEPHFVDGLDQFEAVHDGPFGKIISSWAKSESGYTYQVVVPANSTATVRLPTLKNKQVTLKGRLLNKATIQLTGGTYNFTWQ